MLKPKDVVQIYPNPNDGSFTVQLSGDNEDKVLLEVYDLVSKQVFEKEFEYNPQIPITLNLNKGLYIVQIKQENILIHQEKIVIQ